MKNHEIKTPEKCLNCEHTIIQFENINVGFKNFEYNVIIRCDCFPAEYICGSIAAECYCKKGVIK